MFVFVLFWGLAFLCWGLGFGVCAPLRFARFLLLARPWLAFCLLFVAEAAGLLRSFKDFNGGKGG